MYRVLVSFLVFVGLYIMFVTRCDTKNDNFLGDGTGEGNTMSIHLINLDSNRSRLAHFTQTFQFSDLNPLGFRRFSAVDAKDLDIADYISDDAQDEMMESETAGFRKKHYELTRGAVGCYMSHVKVWHELVESDASYALVFEDDASLHPRVYNKLLHNLRHIPDDWDIILLGYYCILCVDKKKYLRVNRFHGTHGYLIRKSSAKKMINRADIFPLRQQIDSYITSLISKGIIKVYATYENLVTQNAMFASAIQTLPQKSEHEDGNPYDILE